MLGGTSQNSQPQIPIIRSAEFTRESESKLRAFKADPTMWFLLAGTWIHHHSSSPEKWGALFMVQKRSPCFKKRLGYQDTRESATSSNAKGSRISNPRKRSTPWRKNAVLLCTANRRRRTVSEIYFLCETTTKHQKIRNKRNKCKTVKLETQQYQTNS